MPALAQSRVCREILPAALVGGFGVAVAVWTAWYFTHLPWVSLPEQVGKPLLIGVWGLGLIFVGASVPRRDARNVGLLAGLISAVLGVAIVLTMISQAGPGEGPKAPGWFYVVPAFLALGALLGLIGAMIGRGWSSPPVPGERVDWLKRFAVLTAISAGPLIFAGGLVTSTNSGLAVPDWPTTFGGNVFLYPLGAHIPGPVYLEHSHRLFATLIGLTAITLMVWTLLAGRGSRPRNWAIGVVGMIVLQAVIGGVRVLLGRTGSHVDDRVFAAIHGVSAILILAMLVTLAMSLTRAYAEATLFDGARRLRGFATGAMHALLLQIVFGAIYRHFRGNHALVAHIVFAVVALIFASVAALKATTVPASAGPPGRAIRGWGYCVVAAVWVQFVLGWVTFLFGGGEFQAANGAQAILRTSHQANGAFVLAAVVALAVLARKAAPRGTVVAQAV